MITSFHFFRDTIQQIKSCPLSTLNTTLHGSVHSVWQFRLQWAKACADNALNNEQFIQSVLRLAYFESKLELEIDSWASINLALLKLECIEQAPSENIILSLGFLIESVSSDEYRNMFMKKYRRLLRKRDSQHRKPVALHSRNRTVRQHR